MKVKIYDDYNEVSEKVNKITSEIINNSENALISFPGGDTPKCFIEKFVTDVNAKKIDISKTKFVSLDEWVGLSNEDKGGCAYFLNTVLFNNLKYSFAEKFILNGANADINDELQKHQAFFDKNGPLTLSVLGVGMNGHIGFNESGVDISLNSHIIPLDDVTKNVMVKYFGENFKPTQGITQGINQIMQAKTVIVIANGEHKSDIIYKSVNGEITNKVPLSVLQNHPNCYLIIDKAAASKL